ncbi:hypothetical protein H5410_049177 [Solanum commersonii]|uniref:Uncharacterized protein n=1 Tax=Solanum commersonii TaxID=4109 RepID=A0A9J5XMP6_SOLCO|nr:hypothetical protein H5410_049177 [Solanum commersonii]
MGFAVTSLIFVVVGVIASFGAGICCNRGPSTNLCLNWTVTPDIDYHCYSVLLDDVGNCVPCAVETAHRTNLE